MARVLSEPVTVYWITRYDPITSKTLRVTSGQRGVDTLRSALEKRGYRWVTGDETLAQMTHPTDQSAPLFSVEAFGGKGER